MLNGKDILDAWIVWKGAGLIPPKVPSEQEGLKQLTQMTQSMLRQYGHLEPAMWGKAVDILAHCDHWPRFSDIDETLKSLREKAEAQKVMASLSKPASLYKANIAKIKAIVEHIGKGGSFKGLLQEPAADVVEYAKKIFPDCDMDFIKRNYCDISTAKRYDEMCNSRAACVQCPFSWHAMFLKISPRGGNTYMCADSAVCGRYRQ